MQKTSVDVLSIADYTLQLVAVAYGVFATAVDFKTEKNGVRRLSRTGVLGLTFLFLTSLAAIQIKVLKQRRDEQARQSERAIQDQANANIARNVEMSKMLVTGLSRMQDPVEGNFTLLLTWKLGTRPFDAGGVQPGGDVKSFDPLKGLAVRLSVTDGKDVSFAIVNFASKCLSAQLSATVEDVTLSCVGPSTALQIGTPVSYADLDGTRVYLQVFLDDRGLEVLNSPTVSLTGTRKTFKLDELTRQKPCPAKVFCFAGVLRVSPL